MAAMTEDELEIHRYILAIIGEDLGTTTSVSLANGCGAPAGVYKPDEDGIWRKVDDTP